MVSFGAFWVALPRCMLFRATAQESETEKEGRKSPGEGRHSALIGERTIHQILYFHLSLTHSLLRLTS